LSDYSNQTLAKPQRLSPAERTKLGAILARLASPYDGERAAAGLLASAFVARHNLAWSDLTSLLQPAPETPAGSEATQEDRQRAAGKAWLGYCHPSGTPPGQALNLYT
jgi:hypothetical protein